MNQVITAEHAKKVTGGRMPLQIMPYEEACRQLDACITLDDAKYFSDAADALAAWAKIYHDPKADRKSRQVKLKAYRRMGEIAAELRPCRGAKGGTGRSPGPVTLLRENGLSKGEAQAARKLARVPIREVDRLINLPRVPSPASLKSRHRHGFVAAPHGVAGRPYSRVEGWGDLWSRITSAVAIIKGKDARVFASAVDRLAAQKVRERVQSLIDWLDEFEQYLPKGGDAK